MSNSRGSFSNMPRHGRSTSVDFNMSEMPSTMQTFRGAIDRITKKAKQQAEYQHDGSVTPKMEGTMVWRDMPTESTPGRWRKRKVASITATLAGCLCLVAFSSGLFSSGSNSSQNLCNPFDGPGSLHTDYSEPSNTFWKPSDTTCPAPRYMAKLRSGDIRDLDWMRNKTVLLIGDSIERDHVSLFCSLMGRDAEVIKGKHPLAIMPDTVPATVAEKKKKDRAARIAYKGMQESTLPRICYIEELNFVMTNLYHFGLDEQGFWKDLDQYHGPPTIEERFATHYLPFINKLRADDRPTAPDLVEISSGMYDLARWAKQDESAGKSTTEDISAKELEWYAKRVKAFMDTTSKSFPQAVKLWRGVTMPEDQASELDYFNDRFSHSRGDVAPYFSENRIGQVDAAVRKIVQPFQPSRTSSTQSLHKTDNGAHIEARSSGSDGFAYNTWSRLVEGVPAHQTDRLHGGDLAAPGAVLWSDIILWHLKQGVASEA